VNTTSLTANDAAAKISTLATAKTILVVEDSQDDVALLRLMFRRARILNPLQSVHGVHDAIAYIKGEGMYTDRVAFPFPTLLFVDLHLRDGSGFDILRWIQVHRTQSPAAVVALSGSDVNAFQRAYDLGAHSFLTKPLRFEDFENMVKHVRGIKLTTLDDGHVLELE
jgi:two-component system response regulator